MNQILSLPMRSALATLAVVAAASAFVTAQAAPDRLPDREIKRLIDQVDEGRDKFEGNLDGKFKGSTVRGATGEIKVSGALQDYQDSTHKLKERFTADYAAGAEVATVLRQSTAIDNFMKGSPSSLPGRSEWDRQAAIVKRLADAYAAPFPYTEGAAVRRMNDKETAAAAAAITEAADQFKSDLDKATSFAKPARDAAKKEVELLGKQASALKSRTSDGKPATAEMRQVAAQVAKVQSMLAGQTIPSMTNWQAVNTSLAKLQQAFGLTP